MSETNYERYFGTPEKAAETIEQITSCCCSCICSECLLFYGKCTAKKDIIEWLESEAE